MTAHPQSPHRLTPARGALALVLSALFTLLTAGCGSSTTDLIQVETEKEANHILTVLASASAGVTNADPIVGTKQALEKQRKTVWQVRVPSKDAENARRVLLAHDLPKDKHPGLSGLASSSGLIPSRTDERARLMDAIAGELQKTIESIDGVVSARVHVVVPEREALAGPDAAPSPTRASVIVQTTRERLRAVVSGPPAGSEPEANAQIPAPRGRVDEVKTAEIVRELVRNAVDGLEDKNLSVSVIQVARVEAAAAPMTSWGDIISAARARAIEPRSLAVILTAGLALALVLFLLARR